MRFRSTIRFRNTVLAVVAICGSSFGVRGQSILDLTSVDPSALEAVQINAQFQFGPTGPSVKCTSPTTFEGVSVCPSVTNLQQPPMGYRLVITNISAAVSYNQNGGGEVMTENLSIGLNVGGNIFFSYLPFDHIQTAGATTLYTFNKAVHMYADPAVGFPELLLSAVSTVGPFFKVGTGSASITIQGYLVKTS